MLLSIKLNKGCIVIVWDDAYIFVFTSKDAKKHLESRRSLQWQAILLNFHNTVIMIIANIYSKINCPFCQTVLEFAIM